MKKGILLIVLTIITFSVYSQTSSIRGSVKDEATGETLPGVKILIEGTQKMGMTDFDGKFNITGIPVGTYAVSFKYATYNTKKITDVIVKQNDPVIMDILLASAVSEQAEVTVTATLKKESSASLLLTQKNAATVSDGISSESIRRTPDRSTSDVLKRISGASIQDNKFAVIRGLNDRYNAAYINGAPLPSSESDRKAFSFDIFPANMLDNLVIIKTATPDLPGEFAGGIIQVNTKSIPEENFQSFTINGGYNTITTGKNQLTYKGGKTDWLGIDDGTRAMPSSIPSSSKLFPSKVTDQAILAKSFTADWALQNQTFAPNSNFQYAIGHTFNIKTRKIGIVSAINYNRTNVYTTTQRSAYDNGSETNASVKTSDLLDKNYSVQTMAGALVNVSLKWNENNQIGFKNVLSINSEDRVIDRSGKYILDGTGLKSIARWFTSNQIYTGQLIGDHYIPKGKIKINWIGSFSSIERKIPNLRRSVYTNSQDDTTYRAAIENSTGPSYGGGMFFSQNNEGIASFKTDVVIPINTGEKLKTELKIGGFVQHRYRDFKARQLGYAKYNKGTTYFNDSLLLENESTIFSNKNMGEISPGVGGFKLIEGTKPSDSYNATSDLQAAFVMLDNKLNKNLRLIWGARAENFKQNLSAIRDNGDTLKIDHPAVLDILPSVNFVYSMTEKQNLRLSYSQTLNRPEYRELAPFAFYDFSTQFVVSGNDSLKRAKIQNMDLRYELYPGKGQLISGSFFYKQFSNPIEQVSRPDVQDEIYYRNVGAATNYGVELEARFLMSSLLPFDSVKFLNDLTLFSNVAIIRSNIDLSTIVGAKARPLQGQSPYVFNAGATYANSKLDYSISLNLNKVGPRIFIVGNVNEPDIWENSRTFVDLQIAKTFLKKKLEVKFNAQNILAQRQIFYQNSANGTTTGNSFINSILYGDKHYTNGYDSKADDTLWNTNFGRVFTGTITYRF